MVISAKYWHYTGYISNVMLTLAKCIDFTLEIFLIKRYNNILYYNLMLYFINGFK